MWVLKNMNFTILENLCKISAVSGDEECLRTFIVSEIKNYSNEIITDNLGNLIIKKAGKKGPCNRKIMVTSSMDEVGFIITNITKDGFLKFNTVGLIDYKVLLGTRVLVGENNILGVIGSVPVHLLRSEEKYKKVKAEDLYIDIGANNKEDAEKYIKLGDYASFEPVFLRDSNNIRARALDSRLGCYTLIDLLKREYIHDLYFAFTTKEKIGSIGATTVAYTIKPDTAFVISSTMASDVYETEDENTICKLGEGPVAPFMDKGTIYCKDLYSLALKLTKEKNIPIQTKMVSSSITDASVIQKSRGGIKTLEILIPCRYINSPISMCKIIDLDNTEKLSFTLLEHLIRE